MKLKKSDKEKSDNNSSKINDGLCCRCVNRKTNKVCKITGKYVPRKHKCDVKVKDKIAFKYKD